MTDTVIGTFTDWDQVGRVVGVLSESGFSAEQISIIGSEGANQHVTREVADDQEVILNRSAAAGAAVGAAAGLGIALTALAVPLVGPVLVAGPILAAIASVGAGASAGGLLGILVGNGWSRDRAMQAHGAIERGEILVAVQAGDKGAIAANLLARAGASATYHEESAPSTPAIPPESRAVITNRPREMPEGLVTASASHIDPLQLPGAAGERARQIEAAQRLRMPEETASAATPAVTASCTSAPLRSAADIAGGSSLHEEDEELETTSSP